MLRRLLALRIPFMGKAGWIAGLLSVIFYSYIIDQACACSRISTTEELILTVGVIFIITSFFLLVFFGSWRRYGYRQIVFQVLLVNSLVIPAVIYVVNMNPNKQFDMLIGIILGFAIGMLLHLICQLICMLLPGRRKGVRYV